MTEIDNIEDELEKLCLRLRFQNMTGLKTSFNHEGFKAIVSIKITDKGKGRLP